MTFPEYETFDGLGLAHLVQTGVLSQEELLNAAIERIETLNPILNAVILKMYDEAKRTLQKGVPEGLFAGVPFLIKDLLGNYKGFPSTCGSRLTQHWIPEEDSEVVKRLKQSGLVIVGKTSTPEFGLSPVTESDLFGPTYNPWNLAYSPGGSSGGSAASVASRMVPMAHGGDGGGSIRIPASFCGLFGLKPSRGRVPSGPLVMRVWQGMVVEHALTRSVRDSAALLDVVSGPEIGSPISLPLPSTSFLSSLDEPCRKLKIAVTDKPFFDSEVSSEYQEAFRRAVQLCEMLGHEVVPVTLDIEKEAIAESYIVLMSGEMRFSLEQVAKLMRKKINLREVEVHTAVLSHLGKYFTAAEYAKANHTLDMAGRALAQFFQQYDVLLTPTVPVKPPKIGELKYDVIEKNVLEVLRHVPYGPMLKQITRELARRNFSFTPFTPLFNITGQPAMSVPLYWGEEDLPIGIQCVGRFGDEATLFQLAKQFEEALPWKDKRPTISEHWVEENGVVELNEAEDK